MILLTRSFVSASVAMLLAYTCTSAADNQKDWHQRLSDDISQLETVKKGAGVGILPAAVKVLIHSGNNEEALNLLSSFEQNGTLTYSWSIADSLKLVGSSMDLPQSVISKVRDSHESTLLKTSKMRLDLNAQADKLRKENPDKDISKAVDMRSAKIGEILVRSTAAKMAVVSHFSSTGIDKKELVTDLEWIDSYSLEFVSAIDSALFFLKDLEVSPAVRLEILNYRADQLIDIKSFIKLTANDDENRTGLLQQARHIIQICEVGKAVAELDDKSLASKLLGRAEALIELFDEEAYNQTPTFDKDLFGTPMRSVSELKSLLAPVEGTPRISDPRIAADFLRAHIAKNNLTSLTIEEWSAIEEFLVPGTTICQLMRRALLGSKSSDLKIMQTLFCSREFIDKLGLTATHTLTCLTAVALANADSAKESLECKKYAQELSSEFIALYETRREEYETNRAEAQKRAEEEIEEKPEYRSGIISNFNRNWQARAQAIVSEQKSIALPLEIELLAATEGADPALQLGGRFLNDNLFERYLHTARGMAMSQKKEELNELYQLQGRAQKDEATDEQAQYIASIKAIALSLGAISGSQLISD